MISHPEVRTKSWDSTTQNISALKLKVNVGRQMINYNFNDCWHYCEINDKLSNEIMKLLKPFVLVTAHPLETAQICHL